eukprot:3461095-Amphidinium_carterae.1
MGVAHVEWETKRVQKWMQLSLVCYPHVSKWKEEIKYSWDVTDMYWLQLPGILEERDDDQGLQCLGTHVCLKKMLCSGSTVTLEDESQILDWMPLQ